MTRREKRVWLVAVALAGGCSSPSMSDEGFISLGRDVDNGPIFAGRAPTGGVPTGGAVFTGGASVTGGTGFVGMGGTLIPEGGTAGDLNGGTSTGADGGAGDAGDANGGTTGGTGGTAGANGGTGGANGGTGGGDGPICGSGLPVGNGGVLFEDCENIGWDGRVCLPDDSVLYCGQTVASVSEQCDLGTCATGCCHAASDPCPTSGAGLIDCAGDCADNTNCMFPQMLPVPLRSRSLHTVRVGADTAELQCGERTVHYAAMYLVYDIPLADQAARITVSPPWALSQQQCEPSTDQCVVARGGAISVVTDVDPPPPRNVFIETGGLDLACP